MGGRGSMMEQLIKVFVYGTLKRGEPNHHWLTRPENGVSRFVAEARTAEKFPLVVGTRYNIPFLLNKPGVGHHVGGEVYEVDSKMFSQLDVLEEYPRYYDREVQTVVADTDQGPQSLQCWLYLLRNFPEKLLEKPHLESYHNQNGQLYIERSERAADLRAVDDLNF